MKNSLLDTFNTLDNLHLAYEGLEILACGSNCGDSKHVGSVLRVINESLELELNKAYDGVKSETIFNSKNRIIDK